MKNLILFLFVVCNSSIVLSQDALKQIKGKVMYLESPLVDAQISLEGSDKTVRTGEGGAYEIEAKKGDLLAFSYPNMKKVEILVEDVTRILNIQMTQEVNMLDEVVVQKRSPKTQQQLRAEYPTNENLINTVFGIIDIQSSTFLVRSVEGKDLSPVGLDFISALQLRFPGIRVQRPIYAPFNPVVFLRGAALRFAPAIYDIDGLIFKDAPTFIPVENIERIAILPSLGSALRYGTMGNGGVIVINTKGATSFSEPGTGGKPYDWVKLRDNIYENDALSVNDMKHDNPVYLKRLLACSTEAEALQLYNEQIKMYGSSYFYVLDAYDVFANKWNNREFAQQIIDNNRLVFEENPVALKALAYHYEAIGDALKAHETYKKIFLIRPGYTQSYLDIADSFRDLGEHKVAAAIHARYAYLVEEGYFKTKGKQAMIMERELNNLMALHGNELLSKRDLKKYVLDQEFNGTRLVFEWSDSEAEFELQFVNPDGQYFNSIHSLEADAERIMNEKLMGLSTEELLIYPSPPGVWQINAKYLGNKSLTPTYLKVTIYQDYGTASQRKEVKLFKLRLRNVKQQLFRVSNASSLVMN